MKKSFLLLTLSFFLTTPILAQSNPSYVNYDESKVPTYTLPDLLQCLDGSKVKSVKDWEEKRRPEIMNIFMSDVYGKTPTEKINVSYTLLATNPKDLSGLATSKQVLFSFTNGKKTIEAVLLLYIPNNQKDKVPVIVGYNFMGNHSTIDDPHILYSTSEITLHNPRGSQKERWCYKDIVSRGYAIATMCYNDIYPDTKTSRDESVASLFSNYSSRTKAYNEWGAIGAWAWGSSRIVDYLETEPKIDQDRIAIMGHSRQGKAALWAGAQDKRFKVVISNDSGCGGAALSKRVFGENIGIITTAFPHWFCPSFPRYAQNEENMPFDQHMLISLIAPRHAYVASAKEDQWADPKGEFLSLYHAKDVYLLYKMDPITSDKQPDIHQPIHKDVGYHIRAGKHNVTDYDWKCYLDYCDKYMK